jgi:hypothetical protein
MIYDTIEKTVNPLPYAARGICIQHAADNLPDGFRVATAEEVVAAFPPPEPPVPTYSKLKIVEVIDSMGKLNEFAGMLAHAPTRIQMRWAAAGVLEGDDADLQAVIAMIAEQWKLTPEQVAEILKQCEA